MHVLSTRAAKITAACATPLAVVAAGALVWQGSYAAFTGQTRNSGNDWSTGSVALTDDDRGGAMFQVSNITPGDTDSKCITVTANASVPGTVKGYAVNPTFSSSTLAQHILVTIQEGNGGSFQDCTGFQAVGDVAQDVSLATFAQASNYSNAVGGWDVAAGTQSRTYKMTWRFDTTGMTQTEIDSLQGAHAGLDMQWELQSN
ncbi:hypothetical protein [Nocardioides sp. Kera G14]|uniref:hypothetical protein n=1 Tax=Nocardioides sp. Kera G14 TaxID=2884264 RepID=UPI001D0FB417|nr:hypothetical protein [Nocardioides sp. Kera G14]UDY24154.1 hypothetical protein LH076_02330 [Nocardioides sp. Kera G14]